MVRENFLADRLAARPLETLRALQQIDAAIDTVGKETIDKLLDDAGHIIETVGANIVNTDLNNAAQGLVAVGGMTNEADPRVAMATIMSLAIVQFCQNEGLWDQVLAKYPLSICDSEDHNHDDPRPSGAV